MLKPVSIPLLVLGLSCPTTSPADDDAGRGGQAASPPATSSGGAAESDFALGATFDAELLRDLPGSRRLFSVFETTDATTVVDDIDNGGLYTGEARMLGVHGASWTQVSYRLDQLDLTDPEMTGTPLYLPDLGAFEAVALVSGSMPAEVGGQGPTVTLVPRRPGESWHGTVAGNLLPAGLQDSTGDPPAVARFDALTGGRFLLEGPIVKERLGLLAAGSVMRVRRFERDDPTPVEGFEAGLLTHLVWKPQAHGELRFVGAFQKTGHPYAGRARFDTGDARQRNHFLNLQATWARRGTRPWALSGGYARGAFAPDLGERPPTATVERLRAGPLPRLFPGDSTRSRWMLSARVEPFAGRFGGGQHALRLGLTTAGTRAATRPAGPRALTPETVNGLPARLWDFGWPGPESRLGAFDLAAYAADRVRYGRVSLDAGLRLELTRGSADGGSEIRWTALSPRIAARLDVTSTGSLALRAGYARYRHRLPLGLLAFGDPAAAQGLVYRWLDGNANGRFEAGEKGPGIMRVGPGGPSASIDTALQAPSTEELVIGAEARIAGRWTVGVLGIHRRERDLVASVNLGAPPSAYTLRFVPDPAGNILEAEDDQLLPLYDRRPESFGLDRYVLRNVDDNMLHQGLEVALRGAVGERLRLLFGATASKSEGPIGNRGFRVSENDHGLVGESLETPNAGTHSRGRLFFDRAYTLKLAASYRAPGDVRVGTTVRYQDGQPFARVVIPSQFNQGPEPVQAIPNGRSRFTYTLTLDARLEKGLRVGRARVAVALEAFNLLGTSNEVEEDVASGPFFRAKSALQPPRAFLLEVRADF